MGNYLTTAQLIAEFESSADLAYLTDSADSGAASETVLAEVIAEAEAEADSSLAVRYKVPIAVSTDAVLASQMRWVTKVLAIHRLCLRGEIESETRQRETDAVRQWLTDMAAGKKQMAAAAAQPSTVTNTPSASWGIAGEVVSATNQRRFSRAEQECF